MEKEEVMLVDKNDNKIGTAEKMSAHRRGGRLHRAFSVFVFNSSGDMLIQRRAGEKYHCGSMWTNACCSHQRPDETLEQAAHRKLKQEMGFDTGMREIFKFIYKASFDNGLTEHELDHVFVGRFDGKPKPNPKEASDFRWIDIDGLKKDVARNPDKYTPWFKIILNRVAEWYEKNKGGF